MGVVEEFSNSARKVPLQTARKAILTAAGNPPKPPLLQPNQLQLYSYYKPGLEAGRYVIDAEQKITSHYDYRDEHHDEAYHIFNCLTTTSIDRRTIVDNPPIEPQEFEVVAPQFSLDPKLINSYYPPSGHQDESRILPHICLEDPHFPWEREADDPKLIPELEDEDQDANGKFLDESGHVVTDRSDAAKRNCVPWIALMVFDHDDLPPLQESEKKALNLPDRIDLTKQPSNGAFQMTVKEYLTIAPSNRVDFEDGEDVKTLAELKDDTNPSSQERMTAIFPLKKSFRAMFPDIRRLKYAAHVRNINTTGFPDAGVDQNGLYSIIVSTRTGNYNIDKPTVQICHLVSVEYFETTRTNTLDKEDPDGRIALISLFSWTYMALPPNPINFVDSIEHVLQEMQVLRPRPDIISTLQTKREDKTTDAKQKKALTQLEQRLTTGYTLARWRTETGEETAAFSRGPLIPQKLPNIPKDSKYVGNAPVADWAFASKTGKEYQIFDTQTGLMDLSYSAAWALGKTLAISDTTFNNALSRFRSAIQKWAQSQARKIANNRPSAQKLVGNVSRVISTVDKLSSGTTPQPNRVPGISANTSAITSLLAPEVEVPFVQSVKNAVLKAGSTMGGEIYNELNKDGHNSSDWTVIHKWISEKLYLSDIPAHVFIPDPSFLPEESLRFFHIDDTWMDCLIDGALSVANHLDTQDDWLRAAIKSTYNEYLKLPYDEAPKGANYKPQIPGYGFILRSQIVKVMPDLRITVTWQKNPLETETSRADFCRWMRPDDHTLLCLLDRPPEEIDSIQLAQPPHQQRFSFGHTYNPTTEKFEFSLRQLYTSDKDHGSNNVPAAQWNSLPDRFQPEKQPSNTQSQAWIDPNTRVIEFSSMATFVNTTVRRFIKEDTNDAQGFYDDFVPNSAELALELNDPSYYFLIRPWKAQKDIDDPNSPNHKEPTPASSFTARNRQLWAPADIALPAPIDDTPPKTADSKPLASTTPHPAKQTIEPIHPLGGNTPASSNPVIPFKDIPTVPADPSKPIKGPVKLSKFALTVYADYKGPPVLHKSNRFDRKNFLATQNTYLYDLIFSIRRREKADYNLREIVVNVPHTGVRAGFEPVLDAGARGPRARMLSNQRFVPLLNWTKEVLQIRLVPRSAKAHPTITIDDNKTREISFRLEEVAVVPTQLPVEKRSDVNFEGGGSEKLAVCVFTAYERYEVQSREGNEVEVMSGSPTLMWNLPKRDVKDPDEPLRF